MQSTVSRAHIPFTETIRRCNKDEVNVKKLKEDLRFLAKSSAVTSSAPEPSSSNSITVQATGVEYGYNRSVSDTSIKLGTMILYGILSISGGSANF